MNHIGVAFYQQRQVFIADLGHVNGLEARTEQAQPTEARQRAFAALFDRLLHFEGGFMDVHVDRRVQFLGDYPDFLQVFVAHSVGGVVAEGDFDPLVVLEIAEQFNALTNGFIRSGSTWNREIEDRNRDLRANTAVMHPLAGNLREEIHVREAGDAPFYLLGDGQIRAIAHEIFIDPFGFGRPDVVFQPSHQRQIIGQAAEQRHRRVAMGVDQAGADQNIWQLTNFSRVTLQRFGTRADKHDATVADTQAVLFEDHACGFDGYQPGRQQ